MGNKWEVKEAGEESYAISDGKISIVTSDADNDQYLQAIVDLLNSSGYRFHSENKLELDLHIEAEMAKMELIELKAKCERYKEALKAAQKQAIEVQENHFMCMCPNPLHLINEALSAGEGEKEVGNG